MKVFNTLTRKKEHFNTIEENKVKMYVCGPTVYDSIHIGNARPYVVFDAIRRYLEYKGYDVVFIQNFTDVDDKIIKKANDENVSMNVISERYIEEILKEAEILNVKKATYNPRVTQEIDEIIEMIKTLIEKGFAYEKNGTVFFSAEKNENYGKLSHKNIEDLVAGSRVDIDSEKDNPADFVLWKPKKEGEPFWNSPWGEGRPGWHIECSVMAKKYLGDTIDIHAGGEDLVFPHHENEIAQSEAANGKPFANYWLHNAFVNIDNQKMSKSKGNFFTVKDILKYFDGDVVRFFILSSHYRSPINFSDELMKSSRTSLDRIKNCISNLDFLESNAVKESLSEEEDKLIQLSEKYIKEFETSMDDDFNTADAISHIFELVRFTNSNTSQKSSKALLKTLKDNIQKLCDVLGINTGISNDLTNSEEIEKLIEERTNARKNKDFKTADAIRDKLTEMNVVLEDTPLGVRWSYKGK